MRESLYILTSIIPKDGEFEAYFKHINLGQIRVTKEGLKYKKYENISSLLQFFIENNLYPLSVYDNTLKPIGLMNFDFFKKSLENCRAIDIEVLNPNKFPNYEQDEIVCISYGNKDFVTVRFNGEEEDKIGEKYASYFSDEKKMIEKFLKDLAQSPDLFICGYNTASFDVRYIKKRAELLGILTEIKTYTARTLYENKKICLLPNFINIDLLLILQYAGLPSTKLEHVAKIFGLESSKMPIEDLWIHYREKNFDSIIKHNMNDVIITHEIFKKVAYPIYSLAQQTIGTFEYGFYSNLPKNMMIRSLFNFYHKKGLKAEEILKKINEEIKKFYFKLGQEKIKENLNVKFSGRLEKAKVLDLPMKIAKELRNYDPAFEEILESYEKINANVIEKNLLKMLISGNVHRILLNMRKKKEYKDKIESLIEEIKNREKGRIYASSGRYLVVDDTEDPYSYNLQNAILHQKKPKFFLGNCEGILIGTVPKKPIEMPENFYRAFIEDLFHLPFNQPANQMEEMKEKLKKRNLRLDDIKIEVRGVNASQLSTDSRKKNFAERAIKRKMEERERIYVVKLKEGFSTLEETRKKPILLSELDLNYYEKKFSELWEVYKEIKSMQNSLESFFSR
jgi:hypothetical protein